MKGKEIWFELARNSSCPSSSFRGSTVIKTAVNIYLKTWT